MQLQQGRPQPDIRLYDISLFQEGLGPASQGRAVQCMSAMFTAGALKQVHVLLAGWHALPCSAAAERPALRNPEQMSHTRMRQPLHGLHRWQPQQGMCQPLRACAGLPTQPAAAHYCSCSWDGPRLLCSACVFSAACSSLLSPFHCWFSALVRRRFKAHHKIILGP
jgi:hypothetical protein